MTDHVRCPQCGESIESPPANVVFEGLDQGSLSSPWCDECVREWTVFDPRECASDSLTQRNGPSTD